MTKWEVQYEIGEAVRVKSALMWFVWLPVMPPGVTINDQHEAVFDAVVTDKRTYACDPFWWGYTVTTVREGQAPPEDMRAYREFRALGYQLVKTKSTR